MLLDGDLRAALLALGDSRGAAVLESGSHSVRAKEMTDPTPFGQIVEQLANVASKLQERVPAYR